MADPVYVDNELFLGRIEEQDDFRAILGDVASAAADDPPSILLIYGEGGMGKSQLLLRCRDIVTTEEPLAGGFHVIDIDWESERQRRPDLQVSRDNIQPETVLKALHQRALETDSTWQRHLRPYQEAVERRRQIEAKVASARDKSATGDAYPWVRKLTSEALAMLARRSAGITDKWQEPLARAIDEVTVAGADALASVKDWLRTQAHLDPAEEALFCEPLDTLARALGQGIASIAKGRSLVVFQDTYEIVDVTDPWLRRAMHAAGSRVLWVLTGRDNLRDSRAADGFVGYGAEFRRRLAAWDMRELAVDDVQEYFADRTPERPLSREQAQAIQAATQGVPLAISQAADLWEQGASVEAIVGGLPDRTSRDEIVRVMSERALLHCKDETDREALYLLAMQRRPDADAQRAVLCRTDGTPDLRTRFDQLARRYSAVRRTGGNHLHDAVARFLREHLLTTDEERTGPLVEGIARRAGEATERRRQAIEVDLARVEDRCASDDWQEALFDEIHWRFWYDERDAWRRLRLALVDGFGYRPSLAKGLLDLAEAFRTGMSRDSQRRLALVSDGLASEVEPLLRDLEPVVAATEAHRAERQSILALVRGRAAVQAKRFPQALELLQRAEQGLPENGATLRSTLAQAFDNLAVSMAYQGPGRWEHSADAETACRRAVALEPDRAEWWNRLGIMLDVAKNWSDAAAMFEKALALDGSVAAFASNLGATLSTLKRYDEALAAFDRALQIDPNYAAGHYGRGLALYELTRYDDALAACDRALQIDPNYAAGHYGRGAALYELGHVAQAEAAYRRCVEIDPHLAMNWLRLGVLLLDRGARDEGAQAIKSSIAADPTYPNPHKYLGKMLIEHGDLDGALAAIQRAIELNPRYGSAHVALATCERRLGRLADAEARVQHARELISSEEEYQRACFEAAAGNPDAAIELLAQSHPSWRYYAAHDPDLDTLRDDPRFQAYLSSAQPIQR